MVDQENHLCYVTPVEKRDESTVLVIINSRIDDPSTMENVFSEGWNLEAFSKWIKPFSGTSQSGIRE